MFTEAGVTYIVTKKSENEADMESLIAAVGAYQQDRDHELHQEALLEEGESDTVSISLIRRLAGVAHAGAVRHAQEMMRQGIESMIDPADRERLSRYHAGRPGVLPPYLDDEY